MEVGPRWPAGTPVGCCAKLRFGCVVSAKNGLLVARQQLALAHEVWRAVPWPCHMAPSCLHVVTRQFDSQT